LSAIADDVQVLLTAREFEREKGTEAGRAKSQKGEAGRGPLRERVEQEKGVRRASVGWKRRGNVNRADRSGTSRLILEGELVRPAHAPDNNQQTGGGPDGGGAAMDGAVDLLWASMARVTFYSPASGQHSVMAPFPDSAFWRLCGFSPAIGSLVIALLGIGVLLAPLGVSGVVLADTPATAPATTSRSATTEPAHATTVSLATPGKITGIENFAQISPILYRGEQPTAEGFAELKKMGIKTVVNLRSFHGDGELLKGTGLRYVHIHAKAWHPEDEDVVQFLKVVEDPANQPVFVHCQQGSDRTGYMVAVYRMLEQQWSVGDATAEMRNFAFHPIWIDITAYLDHLDVKSLKEKVDKAPSPSVSTVE
jgi:protein tyrosine phosphatase (PTP) superfamily phosphohydrolase (DUF442 family)